MDDKWGASSYGLKPLNADLQFAGQRTVNTDRLHFLQFKPGQLWGNKKIYSRLVTGYDEEKSQVLYRSEQHNYRLESRSSRDGFASWIIRTGVKMHTVPFTDIDNQIDVIFSGEIGRGITVATLCTHNAKNKNK